ncbi:MAG: recombinase family protein [Oscillospiraceae bacterium]|nr:recombinase family protein [Oscillospiraceae bacterium]
MNQAEAKTKYRKTALYSRLSTDDGLDGESMSISSQKAILESYARDHGLYPIVHYSDDGYTGTNFNRPAFQRMIADIEKGEIGCVITKDLSRLGRNYIESGGYIEVFFPKHDVRYISVNDGVDSTVSNGMDITPFKNILNEFYSRDISKKVKTGKAIRAKQGKFMGTTAPFGLQKDPNDKNHLIIDPMTAPTVKLIFDLALEGLGNNRIGHILYERKILKPASYKPEFSKYLVNEDDPYNWKKETISRILRNPVYKGGMWIQTCSKPSLKYPGRGYIPTSQREVLEDIHEAIVSKEQWQTVQEIMDKHNKVRPCTSGYENIFRRLLVCPDCGQSLLVHTDGRNPKRPLDEKTYYQCTTYRVYGKSQCSAHRISAKALNEAVLEDIRSHARVAMENQSDYICQLLSTLNARTAQEQEAMELELTRLKAQSDGLNQQFIRLYDDLSRGLVSEKQYQALSAHYESQQIACDHRISDLETELQEQRELSIDAERFAEEMGQYAGITELTGTLLNRLVDKIEVYEPTECDGERHIKLKIHYKFTR